MALVNCPDCGRQVSNLAEIKRCPKCFRPFDAEEWQQIANNNTRSEERRYENIEGKFVFENIIGAIWEGTVEDVQYLVEKRGADVNAMHEHPMIRKHRTTPLHTVIERASEEIACDDCVSEETKEIFKYLVSQGASVNVVDDKGKTPLYIATTDKTMYLLEQVGGIDSYSDDDGEDFVIDEDFVDTWNDEAICVKCGGELNMHGECYNCVREERRQEELEQKQWEELMSIRRLIWKPRERT